MDLRSTYHRIAKDWMVDHTADIWWIGGTDKFISLLPPGGSVLDVGCGAGEKAKYLVEKGFSVTGADFSEEMIALAKAKVPKANFFVKDIKEPLDFDTVFDGIFAQAVLLHIPKKQVFSVIKNIIQPLRSGGYFYVAVKEIRPGEKEEDVVVENDYGYDYERFFSYYSLPELKGYLEQAGLEMVREEVNMSGRKWIQVIAKKPTTMS